MDPKISIVTPNYNQGYYLEKTILSVINQNYPNLEYIIIDGGSTDQSVDIIKKYEKYLAYWVSEPDKGMYDAIKKGFDHSTGEIMAWINSDDIYHTTALFTVAKIFTKYKQINWITGRPSFLKSNGTILTVSDGRYSWSKYRIYTMDYRWIQQESTFWRQSLWEESGASFNEKLRYAGDFGLWYEFFKREKLYSVNALLGAFRISGKDQLSQKFRETYKLEIQNLIKSEIQNFGIKEKIFIYSLKIINKYLLSLPLIRLSEKTERLRRWLFAIPEPIEILDDDIF